MTAAVSLGKLGSSDALNPLITTLKEDSDEAVCNSTAEALKLIGGLEVEQALKIYYQSLEEKRKKEKEKREKEREKINEEIIISLVKDLNNNNKKVIENAVVELLDKEEYGFQALLSALLETNEDFSRQIGFALGKCGYLANKIFLEALKIGRPSVRGRCVDIMGETKNARYVEPLLEALKDVDSNVRRRAAGALGEIRDHRAEKPLGKALRDGDQGVRRYAALALIDLRAVSTLRYALYDDNEDVREIAAGALRKIEGMRG